MANIVDRCSLTAFDVHLHLTPGIELTVLFILLLLMYACPRTLRAGSVLLGSTFPKSAEEPEIRDCAPICDVTAGEDEFMNVK